MITTEVMGGLGNQLFQIFHLMSYSLTYRIPFYFEAKESSREDRQFYWDSLLSTLKPFIRTSYQHNLQVANENGFHYSPMPHFNQINRPFKFVGYFQSYKYFERYYDNIYELLRIGKSVAELRSKIQDRIDTDNTISLHIRCGDYKDLQDHHPFLPTSYYAKAIEAIIDETERDNWDLVYFYEAEDHDYVRNMIDFLSARFSSINFISVDHDLQDYEQLLLMSLCKNNIIANSSFSWWGAYLNSNKDKIVCRPSIWFGTALSHNIEDLCPTEWSIVDIGSEMLDT